MLQAAFAVARLEPRLERQDVLAVDAARLFEMCGHNVPVPIMGTCYIDPCGVIARNVLVNFWGRHPEAKVSLERWHKLTRAAQWVSTDEVQKAAPKAKVLNRERVRFEVAGGNYRLVAAFDFRRRIAFVKFIGTHAEYDLIDALTVSQF
jgi:mRNA interferase HigB